MLKVAKFGGSSLSDGVRFSLVREIILRDPERRFIVPSAPGKRNAKDEKITDLLIQCYNLSVVGSKFDVTFSKIRERFENIISDLHLVINLQVEYDNIYKAILLGKNIDYIAIRGEYLSARILAEYLNFEFIDAKNCIAFSEKGVFLPETTNQRVRQLLKFCGCAVIPGFYGAMPDGSIKTFSRGGSDVTGAIIARGTMADIYENWTDVSGFKMADPRYVENPKTISTVSYRELRDLSFMGATVLHEDALFPVRQEGIPIHIRNTSTPDKNGSMIVGYKPANHIQEITGIAGKTGYVSILIEKENMRSFPHLNCEICSILDCYHAQIAHIMNGIDSITIFISEESYKTSADDIIQDVCEIVNPDTIYVEDNISLIAVVGTSIAFNRESVTARIIKCLKANLIDLKMCDIGGSDISIFIGVSACHFVRTQQILYKEFSQTHPE